MKILFITRDFPPIIYGGEGVYAYNFIKMLKRNYDSEIKVDILAIKGNNLIGHSFMPHQVNSIFIDLVCGQYPFRVLEFAYKVNSFIKKHGKRYDLIHDNSNTAISLKTPIIHTAHSSLLLEYKYWHYTGFSPIDFCVRSAIRSLFFLEKKALRRSSLIISPSEDFKKHLFSYLKVKKDIKVIYPGVDSDLFRPIKEKEKKYDLLFAGRIVPRKGVKIFCETLKMIKDRKLKVVICAIKGRLWPYLIKNLRKSKHDITFKKNISYPMLSRFYNEAWLTAFPSSYESFGMVMTESLASGTPVVAFDVAANSEIITNGENGVLVQAYNAQAYREAILDLLSNRNNLIRMGILGREKVINKFNWSENVKKTIEIYKNFT